MAKGKMSMFKILGIVLISGLLLAGIGFGSFYGYKYMTTQSALQNPESPTMTTECLSTTTPEHDVAVTPAYDVSRSEGMSSWLIYNNGASVPSADVTPPLDGEPLKAFKIIAQNTTVADGALYGQIVTGTTPCRELTPLSVKAYPQGNLTVTVQNFQTGTAQESGNGNITIGANEIKYATVIASADQYEIFNNPQDICPNILACFNYTTTTVKAVTIDGASVGVPIQWGLGDTGFESCAVVPFKTIENGATASFKVGIEATATDPTNWNSDLGMKIVDSELFQNKDGSWGCGYQDSNGNNIGQAEDITDYTYIALA